ncbi:MAG TPA: PQQ-binding-like beta-propeller repeat protein, partial [Parvularculaceae bacterium]|nr:PQQ-binding-like beta-propeller repeat protein [Parvularculaceae bacterium]
VPRVTDTFVRDVAVSGGLVFLDVFAQFGPTPDDDVYAFDALTGDLRYQTTRTPDLEILPADGAIYERSSDFVSGTRIDTVVSRNPATGLIDWTKMYVGITGNLAVDRASIYRTEDRDLAIYHRNDGSVDHRLVGDPNLADDASALGGVVSLTSLGEAVTLSLGRVSLFDLQVDALRWSNAHSTDFPVVAPAVANGKIFLCDTGGIVTWIDHASGEKSTVSKFVGAANAPICLSLLATRNLLFASGPFQTVALDINNDLNQLWSYDATSIIAIAPEGVLLVGEAGFDFVGRNRRDLTKIVAYKVAD